ncbi:hypothetical protein [Haladaptatus sp. W1]|nr:hypothetical protein [Haladaptatus sp. W1]
MTDERIVRLEHPPSVLDYPQSASVGARKRVQRAAREGRAKPR